MNTGFCLGDDLGTNTTRMNGFGGELSENQFFSKDFGYGGCESNERDEV